MDKIWIKMKEMDDKNQQVKQQLMGLAKISKDTKSDLQKFKEEIQQKKTINSKKKQ